MHEKHIKLFCFTYLVSWEITAAWLILILNFYLFEVLFLVEIPQKLLEQK